MQLKVPPEQIVDVVMLYEQSDREVYRARCRKHMTSVRRNPSTRYHEICVGEDSQDSSLPTLEEAEVVVVLVSRDLLAWAQRLDMFNHMSRLSSQGVLFFLLMLDEEAVHVKLPAVPAAIFPQEGRPLSQAHDEEGAWFKVTHDLRKEIEKLILLGPGAYAQRQSVDRFQEQYQSFRTRTLVQQGLDMGHVLDTNLHSAPRLPALPEPEGEATEEPDKPYLGPPTLPPPPREDPPPEDPRPEARTTTSTQEVSPARPSRLLYVALLGSGLLSLTLALALCSKESGGKGEGGDIRAPNVEKDAEAADLGLAGSEDLVVYHRGQDGGAGSGEEGPNTSHRRPDPKAWTRQMAREQCLLLPSGRCEVVPCEEKDDQACRLDALNFLLLEARATPGRIQGKLCGTGRPTLDFQGFHLESMPLDGFNLSSLNLSNARLAGASLRKANLRCTDLGNTDLRGSLLEGAEVDAYTKLLGADLSDANIAGVDFREVNLGEGEVEVKMQGAQADRATRWPAGKAEGSLHIPPGVKHTLRYQANHRLSLDTLRQDMQQRKPEQIIFQVEDLEGVQWSNVQLDRANFLNDAPQKTSAEKFHLSGVQMPLARFERLDLTEASFSGCARWGEGSWSLLCKDAQCKKGSSLIASVFNQCRLYRADFSCTVLNGASFTNGTDLRQACFYKARLHRAVFHPGTEITGADLRDAQLQRAVLRQVLLVDADLRGADLSQADLSGADLSGARLEGARLDGARLEGARLKEISVDRRTIWPKGFDPKAHGVTQRDP